MLDEAKKEKLIHLGRFIRYSRTVKNLSMGQIEKKYSFDRALWSKIENGKLTSMPKPELLMQLAKILDCNCVKLYTLVGYLNMVDILRYMTDSHRIRERDTSRKSMKP